MMLCLKGEFIRCFLTIYPGGPFFWALPAFEAKPCMKTPFPPFLPGMNPAFEILNGYYDHIYVLTLARAKERQEKIQRSLNGIWFIFFYGKDKNDFDTAVLEQQGVYNEAAAKKIHRYHKGMTPGQIGCSWSHRCIYEDVIANNYQRVMIFEDDALPDAEALLNVAAVLQELPADAELLLHRWRPLTTGETQNQPHPLPWQRGSPPEGYAAILTNRHSRKNGASRPFCRTFQKTVDDRYYWGHGVIEMLTGVNNVEQGGQPGEGYFWFRRMQCSGYINQNRTGYLFIPSAGYSKDSPYNSPYCQQSEQSFA
jgi:GR25 family glycosyltransferase involved in LPS biosynthesis